MYSSKVWARRFRQRAKTEKKKITDVAVHLAGWGRQKSRGRSALIYPWDSNSDGDSWAESAAPLLFSIRHVLRAPMAVHRTSPIFFARRRAQWWTTTAHNARWPVRTFSAVSITTFNHTAELVVSGSLPCNLGVYQLRAWTGVNQQGQIMHLQSRGFACCGLACRVMNGNKGAERSIFDIILIGLSSKTLMNWFFCSSYRSWRCWKLFSEKWSSTFLTEEKFLRQSLLWHRRVAFTIALTRSIPFWALKEHRTATIS